MARPPFARVHKGIIVFLVVMWGAVVLFWWSLNAEGGGFVSSETASALAIFGLGVGVAVVAVVALVARFLFVGATLRSAFLVGVPVVLFVWAFGGAIAN